MSITVKETVRYGVVEKINAFTLIESGARGPQGPKGDTGDTGPQGLQGEQGPPGEGVPVGGTTGQLLSKQSDTDFDSQWVDPPAGGSGGALVKIDTGVIPSAGTFVVPLSTDPKYKHQIVKVLGTGGSTFTDAYLKFRDANGTIEENNYKWGWQRTQLGNGGNLFQGGFGDPEIRIHSVHRKNQYNAITDMVVDIFNPQSSMEFCNAHAYSITGGTQSIYGYMSKAAGTYYGGTQQITGLLFGVLDALFDGGTWELWGGDST